MGAELTKDNQGLEHLALTSGCYNSEENIIDSPEAYETLKILGYGDNDGLIITKKVYSKLDKKVYIIKEIKFKKSQEDDKDKTLSEEDKDNLIKILNSLKDDKDNKCENVIKNYKTFSKGNYLYILDEYINNGDLLSYMKTYKDLNQKIKEENLWDIFLQCANALKFLHSKNIVHRNIRLENIYMNNNKDIKLGNFLKAVSSEKQPTLANPFFNNSKVNTNLGEEKRFKDIVGGVFYRSPEMLSNSNYGKKTDIYSLGVVFYKLCFFDFPNSKLYTSQKKSENIMISPKMSEIIGKMLSEESKRPNAEELYLLILEEYSKIFNKNTSIEAVLRCLRAYKKTTENMLKNLISYMSEKTPFTYNFIKCIENFQSNNEKNSYGIYLTNIRNLINNIYDTTNKTQEINPSFVLEIMLEELNRETNLSFKGPSFKLQPFTFSSKENANQEFLNYFSNNYKSDYSKYFCGGLKTKRNCYTCKASFYNFYSIPYIEFQLDKCFTSNENLKLYQYEPKLVNWFGTQYNHCKVLNITCKTCKSKLSEFKQIEPFQHHLILTINRGEGYLNKDKIEYPLAINLKFPYDLIGIIKRISDEKGEESFISISLDYSDGKTWTLSSKGSTKQINNPLDHSEGDIVMLCYSLRKNN